MTEVESHKHLGLTKSDKLKWTEHVNIVAVKANKRVDIMARLKYILDRRSLEQVYVAFVRPIMEYASIVWTNCTMHDADLLESIQKRAARIVSGAIRGTPTHILYTELGWETLSKRRERNKHKLITN